MGRTIGGTNRTAYVAKGALVALAKVASKAHAASLERRPNDVDAAWLEAVNAVIKEMT